MERRSLAEPQKKALPVGAAGPDAAAGHRRLRLAGAWVRRQP